MSDIYHQNYYKQNREKLSEYGRKYYYAHKKEMLVKQKAYKRSTQLSTYKNGKHITVYGLNKDPYPIDNLCQTCGRKVQLSYHHWNDADYNDGIWVCYRCHRTIEIFFKTPKLRLIILDKLISRLG